MLFNILTNLLLASLIFSGNFSLINLTQDEVRVEVPAGPTKILNNSVGIKTTAKGVVVIEPETETILFEKNSQKVLPIASITKLMTALVFLDHNPGWEKIIEIKTSDKRAGGIVYLLPGEKVKVRDLFYLTLVASCNEAAVALAKSTGLNEEEFVEQMNIKAGFLGLTNIHFIDSTGLDPANIATANDIFKLARKAFSKEEIKKAASTKEYEFVVLNKGIKRIATNTDKLLDSFLNDSNYGYQILGAKTGYLEEVGYCLVIEVEKIKTAQQIILVILGSQTSEDRWQETKGLVDWVFANYEF